jgi:hypothetical protein
MTPAMTSIRTVRLVSDDFWAVVLADPDLLDEAFAEVMASWDADLPPAPPNTLWGGSDRAIPTPSDRPADDPRSRQRVFLRAVPRPQVARSPPR